MYKALNPILLGISGRQSELVELALTYGFRGIECDIQEFAKRVQTQGLERAKRYLDSGHLRVSSFELPMRWRGDESTFQADLEKMEPLVAAVAAAGAKVCHTRILPATDMFPYHENFELHRKRLSAIADALGRHGIRLAVQLLAASELRAGKSFQFIHEAEALATLIKSISSTHLGLWFDSWNWHFGGGNEALLRSLGGARIVAVSLADAPADADAATVREEQRTLPQEGGAIANVAWLKVLAELGFQGPVALEPHPLALSGLNRDAVVQRVSTGLDSLLQAADLSKSSPRPAPAAT